MEEAWHRGQSSLSFLEEWQREQNDKMARDRANLRGRKPTYKSHHSAYETESGGKVQEEFHYSTCETKSGAKVKDKIRYSTYEKGSEAKAKDELFLDMVMTYVVCRIFNLAT